MRRIHSIALTFIVFIAQISLTSCALKSTSKEDQLRPSPVWLNKYEVFTSGELVRGNDSVLIQRQLRKIAMEGLKELDDALALVGGAGFELDNLDDGESPVSYGQLKQVCSKFYDRFDEIGFVPGSLGWPFDLKLNSKTNYPWKKKFISNDHSPATLEQAMDLFSWNIRAWASIDTNYDGITDIVDSAWAKVPVVWKQGIVNDLNAHFYDPAGRVNRQDDILPVKPLLANWVDPVFWDYDGDGESNLCEFQNGSDPIDVFNGDQAKVYIINGEGQRGLPGRFLNSTLFVNVKNPEGTELIDVPVLFTTDQKDGAGMNRHYSKYDLSSSLLMKTGQLGAFTAYFSPDHEGAITNVTATLPNGDSVDFTMYTVSDEDLKSPPIRNFISTDNGDGTTTYTWTSAARKGSWFRLEDKQENGSWKVVYETTYGSDELPWKEDNNFTLTIKNLD